MAKILCAYSGIEFTCEHFPITLHARESYHPIFNVPQKKLLSYLGKWAGNELTPTDSYLLFLSLLNSSELVDFRVPASHNPFTPSIVAQNMEYLSRTLCKLNTVYHPGVVFPRFAITPETKFLSNVHAWIEVWDKAYQDFQDGYRSAHDSAKLIQREHALERLIKNPYKSPGQIAPQLAEWAATAGSFPTSITVSPFTNHNISLADYYKEIIVLAAKEERLYSIPRADLEELIEHCESNIDAVGSIFSHTLFKILRSALERQKNFLGLGDYDLKSTFTIMDDSTSTEEANLQALIQSAPATCPRLEQYPSKFEYMKAKFRWDMAVKAGQRKTADPKDPDFPEALV